MEYLSISTVACSFMMITVSIEYLLRIFDYCTKPGTSKKPSPSEEDVLLNVVKTLEILKHDLNTMNFEE
jgi:hypothetical protein